MSMKKVLKYCGRAVTWRTVEGQMRYSAEKRTALDGKVWWCIFDHKENKYLEGHKSVARYLMEDWMGRAIRRGELPTDKSDFFEDTDGFKKGEHKFSVDVLWTVARSFEIEARSRKEAQKKVQGMVDRGDVCVWTDGFEATDDVEVRTSGEELKNGEIQYF